MKTFTTPKIATKNFLMFFFMFGFFLCFAKPATAAEKKDKNATKTEVKKKDQKEESLNKSTKGLEWKGVKIILNPTDRVFRMDKLFA